MALESNYACMGITGAQIGALSEAAGKGDAFGAAYVESPPPSPPVVTVENTKKEMGAGAIAGIAVAAAAAVIFMCLCIGLIKMEKAGKPDFATLEVARLEAVKIPPV